MMKRLLFVAMIILIFGSNLYAADGNLIVNGNVGIGTTTPAAKLDVAGKLQVDANGNVVKINNVPTSFPAAQGAAGTYLQNDGSGGLTWQPVNTSAGYVQGGHYGFCLATWDGESSYTCSSVLAPASCSSSGCSCASGFTYYGGVSCVKN